MQLDVLNRCMRIEKSWRSAVLGSASAIAGNQSDENNDVHFGEEAFPAFFDDVENSWIASRMYQLERILIVRYQLVQKAQIKNRLRSRIRNPYNPFDLPPVRSQTNVRDLPVTNRRHYNKLTKFLGAEKVMAPH